MDIQERITINCKRGSSIDVPLYLIRPWKIQMGISSSSGRKAKVILAYMVQIKCTSSEGDAALIEASVEVEPAEYKRIVDLTQRRGK